VKAIQFQRLLRLQKQFSTLAFAHCKSNPISIVSVILETIPNIDFRLLQKQFNFNGFYDFRNKSQHWLLLIAKAIQFQVSVISETNPKIGFRLL